MLDDPQNIRKNSGPGEEGSFLPFGCTELNETLLDYARTYLNETEENKRKCLEEMKEFFKKEIVEHIEVPDIFYLCFLRSRKFDVRRACNLLKRAHDFVDSHLPIFDRVDPEAVRRTTQSKVVGFLPYRDIEERAILYIRSEWWNPRELKADDAIFGSIVALHMALENPVNQVAGFVVILDFKNITVQQVVGMSNWILFALQALQYCCPCLLKELHIVHTPALIKATWKLVKPLLSEKIKRRITFYKSSHWKSLHRRIDPRILPEELGGQLGPNSYEHWASDIADIEKRYHKKVRLFLHGQKEDLHNVL